MKVSVIVITYNQEKYIKETLDSIIFQSTTHDLEILVHDDCSTDKTLDIIKDYEEKYPTLVKLIEEKENQFSKGEYRILSKLFPLCRGKYIAVCEGDDFWIDPLKIEKQVAFLEKHGEYTFITSCAKNVDRDGNDLGTYLGKRFDADRDITLDEDAVRFFPTAALMVRANAVGNWPEWYYWCGESGDFVLQLVLLSRGKGWFSRDVYSAYRVMTQGSSNERFAHLSFEQKQAYYLERIRTLCEVDKDTSFQYHSGLQKSKLYFEKCIIENESNLWKRILRGYNFVNSQEYRKSICLKEKAKFLLGCSFPLAYSNLTKLRNKIKNGVISVKVNDEKQ